MEEILIRKAEARDYEDLDKIFYDVGLLHKKIHPEIFKDGADFHLNKDYYIDSLSQPENYSIVAECSGQVVGFLMAKMISGFSPQNNIMNISKFGVAEEFRHHNIGSELMNYITNTAKELGCSRIELNVYNNNTPAKNFYKKQGFSVQRLRLSKEI